MIDKDRSGRIAATIRAERARHNLKSTELPAALGISYSSFARRLNGESDWRYSELETLGRLFHMTIDEIVGSATASPDTG